MAGNYTAKNIGVLEFPDNVRKRPGMFLGSDGQSGAQHAAKEIVDNSIDEHLAGHGKIITVVFDTKTGFLTCVDQGRGVPVDFHEKTQESALTTVFTKLNAGGKFDSESYDKAAGLHGVGAACTNAVAESFEVWSYRSEGGRKAPAWHYQKFERGLATTAVIKQNPPGTLAAQKVGTIVRFKLDAQIFHEHQIDPVQLLEFGRDAAALNPGLEMRYIVDGRKFRFFAETGLSSMVTGVKTESPVLGKDFRLYRPGEIDVAICWYDDHEESIRSYVNGSHTTHGGKHVDGFRAALVRALREQSGKDFEAKYWVKGMRAALNWRMNDPVYHGQTKGELASDVENVVRDAVYPHLALWLKQNANLVKSLVERAAAFKTNEDRFRADNKAIKSIKLVDANARGVLPGKLEQAHGYGPNERELFIVEGDSAAGNCFSGDTRVRLINGVSKTFEELVADHAAGIKNYGYTLDLATARTRVAELEEPRVTKHVDELIEVTLSNGRKELCTEDHLFLLRTGEYIRAGDLQDGMELMPHREELVKGRRCVVSPTWSKDRFGWATARTARSLVYGLVVDMDARLSAERAALVGEIAQVHHVDLDKLNDSPANLTVMKELDHRILHARLSPAFCSIPAGEANPHTILMRTDPEYRERVTNAAQILFSDYWGSTENRKAQSARVLQHFKNPENRAKTSATNKKFIRDKFIEIAKASSDLNDTAFRATKVKLGYEKLNLSFKYWSKLFVSLDELREVLHA